MAHPFLQEICRATARRRAAVGFPCAVHAGTSTGDRGQPRRPCTRTRPANAALCIGAVSSSVGRGAVLGAGLGRGISTKDREARSVWSRHSPPSSQRWGSSSGAGSGRLARVPSCVGATGTPSPVRPTASRSWRRFSYGSGVLLRFLCPPGERVGRPSPGHSSRAAVALGTGLWSAVVGPDHTPRPHPAALRRPPAQPPLGCRARAVTHAHRGGATCAATHGRRLRNQFRARDIRHEHPHSAAQPAFAMDRRPAAHPLALRLSPCRTADRTAVLPAAKDGEPDQWLPDASCHSPRPGVVGSMVAGHRPDHGLCHRFVFPVAPQSSVVGPGRVGELAQVSNIHINLAVAPGALRALRRVRRTVRRARRPGCHRHRIPEPGRGRHPGEACPMRTMAAQPGRNAEVFLGASLRSSTDDENVRRHSMTADVALPNPSGGAQSTPQSVTAMRNAGVAAGRRR
jgi:hypothetical protein